LNTEGYGEASNTLPLMGTVGTHRLPHALDLAVAVAVTISACRAINVSSLSATTRRRRERQPRPVADDEARGDGLLYGLKG
jgi:hypothetical protein